MKERTAKILTEIDQEHDWKEGQTFSNGGQELHGTDVCRVCGLTRNWHEDKQNGIMEPEFSFSDEETGDDITLRQAYSRGCTLTSS